MRVRRSKMLRHCGLHAVFSLQRLAHPYGLPTLLQGQFSGDVIGAAGNQLPMRTARVRPLFCQLRLVALCRPQRSAHRFHQQADLTNPPPTLSFRITVIQSGCSAGRYTYHIQSCAAPLC